MTFYQSFWFIRSIIKYDENPIKGIRGAIRYRQWKLHTGIGSKKDEDEKSGWAMAPGRIDGFVAFDDDYEDMTGSFWFYRSDWR